MPFAGRSPAALERTRTIAFAYNGNLEQLGRAPYWHGRPGEHKSSPVVDYICEVITFLKRLDTPRQPNDTELY